MRFRVGREPLGDAVAWVARALPARPVLPVLSGMLLAAGDSRLTVSCFDYEVWAQATIDADVAEAGEALVPGRLLAEITRSLPGFPADFLASADAIGLTCGAAEFTLVCLPAGDYPARPQPPDPAGTVDGGVLATAAAQVVPSASRDDTLPILTAVCLEADGSTLTLAATDRYRLAVRELSWEPVRPDIRAVALVPARTLADAARAMAAGVPVTVGLGLPEAGGRAGSGRAAGDDASGGGDAGGVRDAGGGQPARPSAPRAAEGMISFAGGGKQLAGRLIGGEFIRYRSRFPAEFGCVAEIPAAPLLDAVRRAALVADRASPVRLSFGTGEVVIEARAEGRARAVEKVAASFTGDQPVISFDPQYLLDGLAAAAAAAPQGGSRAQPGDAGLPAEAGEPAGPGAGRIRLQFTSAAKPALITWAGPGEQRPDSPPDSPAGHSDFRYLLVPLRPPARA